MCWVMCWALPMMFCLLAAGNGFCGLSDTFVLNFVPRFMFCGWYLEDDVRDASREAVEKIETAVAAAKERPPSDEEAPAHGEAANATSIGRPSLTE